MALVRSRDTKPEMRVRKLVHGLGFRYRLHYKGLPGRPDMAFPARRKVILVHGCFWHRHHCPMGDRMPKSRFEFWGPKLQKNRERDARVLRGLRQEGWQALVVWECQTLPARLPALVRRIERFLA